VALSCCVVYEMVYVRYEAACMAFVGGGWLLGVLCLLSARLPLQDKRQFSALQLILSCWICGSHNGDYEEDTF
jgi:hypothetical protein